MGKFNKFDLLCEDILNESLQNLKLNKFFEFATKDLPDIGYERIKSYSPDKRLYVLTYKKIPIAKVVKKKHFIKQKFIMTPIDKNLKLKPIILPYNKGMNIKYKRVTPIIKDFTVFIDKCKDFYK
jgi:hypothetical protein